MKKPYGSGGYAISADAVKLWNELPQGTKLTASEFAKKLDENINSSHTSTFLQRMQKRGFARREKGKSGNREVWYYVKQDESPAPRKRTARVKSANASVGRYESLSGLESNDIGSAIIDYIHYLQQRIDELEAQIQIEPARRITAKRLIVRKGGRQAKIITPA
ncbi:MAG: hypothetical protein JW884_00570 [Deltaproteobacteria bacterium]|nr:hypothetical protein [Deltaproteobacteria bacterium]